jgi:lysophospholipid acyltransferase (LPLAT)-like uncharacterized protein
VKRWQAATIGAAGYPIVALLGRTLEWRVEGVEHIDAVVAAGRQPVLAFWHGRILPATYYFRRRRIVVMTSENFDGEWIARIIERFGYRAARGSTSRGGPRALVEMKRLVEQGQPAAVWLAKATGNPIVPFHIEAARHWTARSWDRTQIPKPFSTVALVVGCPIEVPGSAADQDIETTRRALEAVLAGLRERALAMLAEQPHV